MTAVDRLREMSSVSGTRVVTSAHPAASAAGIAMFAQGGNAFDAALATCFMETIALPMKCGLAGDLVALFRRAGGPLQALVSVGPGPAALSDGRTLSRVGPCAVGIPGAPDGYATLHGFAGLPLDILVQPAIRASEAGIAWSRVGLSYLREAADLLRAHNATTPYMPGGKLPAIGDVLRLPGLGALLRRFARYGATLFQHEDGTRLLQRLDAMGGLLRPEDLRVHPAHIEAAISLDVAGATLFATPPPTGGTRLLPMVATALRGTASLIEIVQADRLAASARTALDGGTSVVTAADDAGNAVVVVHSNSFPRFGSGVVLEDGLVMNNRPGRGFDLSAPPGAPGAPAAGRTPPTTLHAWAVQRPDGLVMGATPGGVNQLPWNLQSISELMAGSAPGDIVCSPRWALDDRNVLSVEDGAAVSQSSLRHQPAVAFSQRSAQQILALPKHGLIVAAADPRVAASAMAAY